MDNTTRIAVNKTLYLLKHIALDPLQGKTMAELTSMTGPIYIKKGPLDPDTVFFALQFFGISNPAGNFSLNVDSDLLPRLFEAIEENLQSSKFKAAVLSIKLRQASAKRQARLREKAYEAYKEVLNQAILEAPPWKAGGSKERTQFFETHVYPQARAAHDRIYKSGWDTMQKRISAVTSKTVSPQANVDFYTLVKNLTEEGQFSI